MRRYSIFHPYYLSFQSEDLYRDVALNWKGTAFLYLLILLAILWVPRMVQFHNGYGHVIETYFPGYVRQIPDLVISNGEVSIDKPMPYMISDPGNGQPMLVIDTTGKVNSLEDTKALVLITKSKIIAKKSPRETRTYDLSDVKYFRIDQQKVSSYIEMSRKWLALLFYPVVVLFSFVFRIMQALFYALIGILFARAARVSLSYKALVRLAVIASTPAIILNAVFSLMGAPSMFLLHLAYFLIAMAYLWFGIKANSPEGTPQAAQGRAL